jgi:hypothetical protein
MREPEIERRCDFVDRRKSPPLFSVKQSFGPKLTISGWALPPDRHQILFFCAVGPPTKFAPIGFGTDDEDEVCTIELNFSTSSRASDECFPQIYVCEPFSVDVGGLIIDQIDSLSEGVKNE